MADNMTKRITAADGTPVVYYTWGEEHRGNLPTVVLVHGYLASARINWVVSGVVEGLVEQGRHVVALDARGHGETGVPEDLTRLSEAHMADDVIQMFDDAELESVHLVGFAMGAVIASLVALREPRVKRLVLAAIGASLVERGGHDTGVIPIENIIDALEAASPSEITMEAARSFRSFADLMGLDRSAMIAVARARNTEPLDLSALTVPTLVFAAQDDELALRPEALAEAIPNATLRLAEGDHFVLMAAETFGANVNDFLNETD